MRREERRTIVALGLAGLAGAALGLPALYVLGLAIGPPPPAPSPPIDHPQLVRAALWARAAAGAPRQIKPFTPWGFVGEVGCRFLASRRDDRAARERAKQACIDENPGLQAVDQVARLYMQEQAVSPNGLRQVSRAVWLTWHWPADAVLDTLAAKSNFGRGARGVEAAAATYFGRPAGDLTPAQAALLAIQVPDPVPYDPWCRPEQALEARNHLLAQMRANGALDEAALEAAIAEPVGVAPAVCNQ